VVSVPVGQAGAPSDEVVWTGSNLNLVTRHLFPVEHGALAGYFHEGHQRLSLFAFGVLYNLPIGVRLVRTDDGTVTADATRCHDDIEHLTTSEEGEVSLCTDSLRTWPALCRPSPSEGTSE